MKLRKRSRFITIFVVTTLFVAMTIAAHAQVNQRDQKNLKKLDQQVAGEKAAGDKPKATPGGGSNFLVPLKAGEDPSTRLGLKQVVWSGAGVDLKSLKGKSVLLFVYATWCPKCNEWSPELLQQLLVATTNRPVVILAINADEKDPTLKYVMKQNFGAPNILHGYDPSMPFRMGYKSNLFRYVWIGPDGLVKEGGYMGSAGRGAVEGEKIFTLAKKLNEATDLGEFDVIQPGLPTKVMEMLWPLELGRPINGAILKKARRLFKGKQKESFDKALEGYLNRQLETITTLFNGSVADRLEAFTKADSFVKQFRSFPQAKQVREILDPLKKDRDFKKELAAMQLYNKATVQGLDPKRRLGMLRGLAKRFKGTYYAEKASTEVQ